MLGGCGGNISTVFTNFVMRYSDSSCLPVVHELGPRDYAQNWHRWQLGDAFLRLEAYSTAQNRSESQVRTSDPQVISCIR